MFYINSKKKESWKWISLKEITTRKHVSLMTYIRTLDDEWQKTTT